MKRFLIFIAALLSCTVMSAQYLVSDKYDLWFEDTGKEVITRKPVACTDNYQDLWNGCYVRISGRTTYIYDNGSSILYGEEINLLYNGYYRVKRSGTWYLANPDGDLVDGIYGKEICYYPWGYVSVRRSSGYWDVYHSSGRKVDFYSDDIPYIYWNGCWGVTHGKYRYIYDSDGRQLSDIYGDSVKLLNDGRWKCVRGSYVTYENP